MNKMKIAKALRDLADAIEDGTPEGAPEEITETKKPAAKKKAATKKKPAAKKTEAKKEESEAAEVTEAELRAEIKSYAKENSRDEAFAILAEFDAKKIADLKEDQYADVMAKLKA